MHLHLRQISFEHLLITLYHVLRLLNLVLFLLQFL
jgi:hypothetical protein